MQALIIIFLLLGIAAFITYLYKSFKKPSARTLQQPAPSTTGEVPYEIEPGRWSDKWYVGPVPTEEQTRNTMTWFVQFFKEFPESGLKKDYPKEHKMAMALLIIDKINLQLQRGEIDQAQYDIEYEKASELIDISEDIV